MNKQLKREDIRATVEDYYGIDISKVTRKREYIDAKRIYCYVSRLNRHTLESTGELIGVGHDTVLHHERVARAWVKNNDGSFNPKVDLLFGLSTYKSKEALELAKQSEDFKELFKEYLPTLKQIPSNKSKDVLERLKMIIQGYEWKSKGEDETKVRLDR